MEDAARTTLSIHSSRYPCNVVNYKPFSYNVLRRMNSRIQDLYRLLTLVDLNARMLQAFGRKLPSQTWQSLEWIVPRHSSTSC
jgi:hypothetical protein